MKTKEKCDKIVTYFNKILPYVDCELNYSKDYELLFAVVLSAQTTDKKVNEITSTLFKKYPNLDSFEKASLNENLALFLSVCIERTVFKFSYGDQCSSTDLPEQLILLPVDNNDIPNYEIMECYAAELKRTIFNKTVNVMKELIYSKTN